MATAPKPASWSYSEDFVAEDEVLTAARARAAEVNAVPIGAGAGAALRFVAAVLGAKNAVEIGTFPGGRDFDDPALFPFFVACAELDVAIFVHPASPLVGQDRLTKYYFPLIVGNPLETALAISKLIFHLAQRERGIRNLLSAVMIKVLVIGLRRPPLQGSIYVVVVEVCADGLYTP